MRPQREHAAGTAMDRLPLRGSGRGGRLPRLCVRSAPIPRPRRIRRRRSSTAPAAGRGSGSGTLTQGMKMAGLATWPARCPLHSIPCAQPSSMDLRLTAAAQLHHAAFCFVATLIGRWAHLVVDQPNRGVLLAILFSQGWQLCRAAVAGSAKAEQDAGVSSLQAGQGSK